MAAENEASRDRITVGRNKKVAQCQDEVANNVDMLNEIFKHLDGVSLAMASCVSKKWKQATDDEGLWEAICTRHWPSSASCQSGQLKSVVMALGGFRRLYLNCLHPLLSRNNSNYKHLKSKEPPSFYYKQKWSNDEVYLSLSLFSIDCYERIAPVHLDSDRRAGIHVWKLCSDEQQVAASFSTAFASDAHRPLDGWRGISIPNHSSRKMGRNNTEDGNYCWGSMDSQSSSH